MRKIVIGQILRDGKVMGTGFLVEPDIVMTVKHNVITADELITDENDREQLSQIKTQIILNYKHTDNFLDNLSLENSSGLSVFVFPFYNESLLNEYKKTDWYIEAGLLFNRKETTSP